MVAAPDTRPVALASVEVGRVADLLKFLVAQPAALEVFLAAQPDLQALADELSWAIETSGALDF